MTPTVAEERMTAAEFLTKYGHCSGVELVKGRVVWAGAEAGDHPPEARMAKFRHGVISNKAARLLDAFVTAHDSGWVATNDTFVPVGPDTVRGADVLYVSYTRVPKGEPPEDLTGPPELVIEVRSPTDRWTALVAKALEYLAAGVTAVVILDHKTRSATVYRDEDRQDVFESDDTLTLPDVLPDFAVPVKRFFE
jgi:Uma2 family endonuclease